MQQIKEGRFTLTIILSMLFGVVFGIILNLFFPDTNIYHFFVKIIFSTIGKMFIATLKMMVVPLVFFSLICGVGGLKDARKVGTLGAKTIFLYMVTTAIAICFALTAALIIQPGEGFNLPAAFDFTQKAAPKLTDVITNIIPANPIKAAAEGNMLQIIFFSLLFGIALSSLGKKGEELFEFFEKMNRIMMNMVIILMHFAPVGVFALIAKVFAEQGYAAFAPLMSYFSVVAGVLVFQVLVVYPSFLVLFAKLNPLTFLKKMRPVMIFAFSTSSSNATLPLTMRIVSEKLGVKKSVASFVLPLGATINMDGTAIMQGVATVFIAQAFNIDIGLSGFLQVVLTATLASIGTAGVPGVGLITLAMVLRSVGLPVEGIGLIIGVDRLLDMMRTGVNICGDATVACLLAKRDNEIDMQVYRKDFSH